MNSRHVLVFLPILTNSGSADQPFFFLFSSFLSFEGHTQGIWKFPG